MKQKKRKVRNAANPSWFGESFHYWPKGALPLSYAMACMGVASKRSEKAGAIYYKIIEAWGKPGEKWLS